MTDLRLDGPVNILVLLGRGERGDLLTFSYEVYECFAV